MTLNKLLLSQLVNIYFKELKSHQIQILRRYSIALLVIVNTRSILYYIVIACLFIVVGGESKNLNLS